MENEKQDLWDKHSLSSRLIWLSLVFAYVYSVLGSEKVITADGVTTITTVFNEPIISTTGILALIGGIIITFGLNAIVKITNLVKAWRNK